MNKVKEQVVNEDFAIYNSDCMYVTPTLENDSIDLSLHNRDVNSISPFLSYYFVLVRQCIPTIAL